MIYLKKTRKSLNEENYISNGNQVLIPIYDDEFVSVCPTCGKIHELELEIIMELIENGDYISGSVVYCEDCSMKGISSEKNIVSK